MCPHVLAPCGATAKPSALTTEWVQRLTHVGNQPHGKMSDVQGLRLVSNKAMKTFASSSSLDRARNRSNQGRISIGALLFAVLTCTASEARAANASHTIISTEQGLPIDIVKCVAQDSLGYIWIGTDDGIVRHDSLGFQTYRDAIPSPYVKDIRPTQDGTLLVVTDRGVSALTTEQGRPRFQAFVEGGTEQLPGRLFYPKAVFEDRAGRLWFSEFDAVVKYERGELERYRFGDEFRSDSYDRAFVVFEDQNSNIYAASQRGAFFSYNADRNEFIRMHLNGREAPSVISDILQTRDREFLAATDLGVFKLTVRGSESLDIQLVFELQDTSCLLEDDNRTLYAGTWASGLYTVRGAREGGTPAHCDDLDFKTINHLLMSNDGSVWVSSNYGVAIVEQPFFQTLSGDITSDMFVTCLTAGGDGLYYASDGYQVQQIDLRRKPPRIRSIDNPFQDVITSLEASGDELFLGSRMGGIAVWQGDQLAHLDLPATDSRAIGHMMRSSSGDLWVCQDGIEGVYRIADNHGLVRVDRNDGLDTHINVVREGEKGHIYLGGQGERTFLYAYDTESQRVSNLSGGVPGVFVGGIVVNDLAVRPDGAVWLATNRGLLVHEMGRFRAIPNPLDDQVNEIKCVAAGGGRVWFGTNHGIFQYIDGQTVRYGGREGLPSSTISYRTLLVDDDRSVLAGTTRGVVYWRRTSSADRVTPTPLFRSIAVDGEILSLPSDTVPKVVTHSYCQVSFWSPVYPSQGVLYQSRIPERQNEWSELSTGARGTFSHLPAGTYTFEARAQRTGYLPSSVVAFAFEVTPPLFLTWWAYAIYAAAITGLVYFSWMLYSAARERRLANRSLRKSEERFRTLVQAASSPIMCFSDDLRILEFNREAERVFGISREDVVGKDLSELRISPQQRSGFHDALSTAGARMEIADYESRVLIAGRSESIILWSFRKLRTDKEHELSVIAIGRDITQIRKSQERMRKAKDLSEAASRAKSQFLANMSHEIRTPLNGVIGMAELLRDTALGKDQHELLDVLSDSADLLLSIINDILDFSKIEAGKLELDVVDFNVQSLSRDIVRTFSSRARQKRIDLLLDAPDETSCLLRGDPTRLRQILNNLIGNALKFTEKGQVAVRVRRVGASEAGVLVRFEVRDTGIGIPKARMGSLFQSFAQIDASMSRRYGGSGLGLAISKQLAELMGGVIGVESEEGRGSMFWLDVTLQEPSAAPAHAPSTESGRDVSEQGFGEFAKSTIHLQQATAGLRILVVEDNSTNQMVAVRLLEGLGHSADVAFNGKEALLALEDHPYEIIFMDCQMPEMDGFEATAAIRRNQGEQGRTPIIAMTAHAMKGDRERCLSAGMDDYISKPIKRDDLAAVIERRITGSTPIEASGHDEPSRSTGEVVFDRSALLELLDGDAEFVIEIIGDFLKDCAERLPAIARAVDEKDFLFVQQNAHTIKGSAASVRANSISSIAARMESAAREGQLDGIAPLVQAIENEMEKLREVVLG